jgi:hypothetical protein
MIIAGKDRIGGLYKIGFVQEPQKLNNRSEKAIHLGVID